MPESLAERLTPYQLRCLVGGLPPDVRAQLAQGPTCDPDECNVCDALDMPWLPHPWTAAQGTWACILHDWHQAAGQRGPAAYGRCMAIYRAAGWPHG